ncbi:hypothetical protein [Shimia ponticola]|uniref:hypothetical protein n=1 Tax=Shimia ponticola TaxID=2582893 RepID=UPI0011BE651B|nr:hypothetical protein [Shimia ponticola]
MPTRYLRGNCRPCPACALRQEDQVRFVLRAKVPCNVCAGEGIIALSPAEIYDAQLAAARDLYWSDPARARDAGWAAG